MAFLAGPPLNWPLHEFMILVACESTLALEKESKSLLMFIGGFDPPEIMDDLSKPFSFLYMSYPASDYEDLEKRIGNIDINLAENSK